MKLSGQRISELPMNWKCPDKWHGHHTSTGNYLYNRIGKLTAIDYWLYNIFGWCLLNGICSSNFYFGGCLNWHCNSINLLKLSGQLIADNAFNWNCPDKVLRKLSINWNCLHTRVYGVGFIYYSKLAATAATNTFVNRPKFVQHPMFHAVFLM